jgi:hypothetical protein
VEEVVDFQAAFKELSRRTPSHGQHKTRKRLPIRITPRQAAASFQLRIQRFPAAWPARMPGIGGWQAGGWLRRTAKVRPIAIGQAGVIPLEFGTWEFPGAFSNPTLALLRLAEANLGRCRWLS